MSFSDDMLNRKSFCKNVTRSLFNYDRAVFFVEGKWGSGKTFLANMWKDELSQQKPFEEDSYSCEVIYYNSWESDDWSDALTPIVDLIRRFVSSDYKDDFSEIASYIGKVLSRRSLSTGISIVIDSVVGFNASKIIKNIISKTKELAEDSYRERGLELSEEYSKFKNQRTKFVELLTKICADQKVVIFIDELDRARPDFALETLEIIKHFFDIPNLYFIVLINDNEFESIIGNRYGDTIQSKEYLRKFYDQLYYIPNADAWDIVETSIDKLLRITNISLDETAKHKWISYVISLKNGSDVQIRKLEKFMTRLTQFFQTYGVSNESLKLFGLHLVTLLLFIYMFPKTDPENDMRFTELAYGKSSNLYRISLSNSAFPGSVAHFNGNRRLDAHLKLGAKFKFGTSIISISRDDRQELLLTELLDNNMDETKFISVHYYRKIQYEE